METLVLVLPQTAFLEQVLRTEHSSGISLELPSWLSKPLSLCDLCASSRDFRQLVSILCPQLPFLWGS